MKKRMETETSRTAEWTCICRAASSLERNPCYRSDDTVALQILPSPIRTLIQIPFYRMLHCHVGAPKGIYEYIIARTRYMDAAYREAISHGFARIATLGAGYDSRAIRFPVGEGPTRIYELDSGNTQKNKFAWYSRGHIPLPSDVAFVAMDLEAESLRGKLESIGFPKGERCLFIMEGVLMYLRPEAVDDLFRTLAEYMGRHSLIAFDYVYADVLRHEKKHWGEAAVVSAVTRVREPWQFGIEEHEIAHFLATYGLHLVHHMHAKDMEETYFQDDRGRIIGRVNGAHCLATAEK